MAELTDCFNNYKNELTDRYDRYERIVKISRDLTIKSKRLIFTLHQDVKNLKDITANVNEKLAEIKSLLKNIAKELSYVNPYQYIRAYSAGIQEYIEALSFLQYLENGTLLAFNECVKGMMFVDDESKKETAVFLTWYDYILGIADMTGELMRRSVYCISHGQFVEAEKICQFLRYTYNAFLEFGKVSPDFNKKLSTLRNSLFKVESSCYTIHIRGKELPSEMLADAVKSLPQPVEY